MLVAIYIRVSTKEQAEQGYSLDAQRRACRAYAADQGWQVVIEEWDDESGKRDDRDGLQRVLAAVRARKVDVVLIHNLDRFMRNLRLLLNFKAELDTARVLFISLIDKIDTSTPEGILQFQLKGMLAEWYSNNLSRETKKGHTEKARQGGWVGPVPLGYTRDGATLAASEDAVIITTIFELYATGLESYTSIADTLNARGYRTLDWKTKLRGLFGRESVRTILCNRAYLGFVSSGGVEFKGKHPALIADEQWHRTQAIRQSRERAGGTFKVAPVEGEVLSSLVYCAACGSKMHRFRTGRPSSRTSRYACSGPRAAGARHIPCDAPMVSALPIEAELIDLLCDMRITPALRLLLMREARKMDTEARPHVTTDRGAIEAKLERMGEVYADGLMRKEKYQQQRAALLAQLAETEPIATTGPQLERVMAVLEHIPDLLRQATREEARAIIAPVFSHVWIEEKQLRAVTPTATFRPLLLGIWRFEVEMGCPTGNSAPLSTRASLWSSQRVNFLSA